jgi:hypothetical protein
LFLLFLDNLTVSLGFICNVNVNIIVRNQIQMDNKKYPGNTMWLLEYNKCRIKKTLTGQRRNTIKTSYVSILRLPSFCLYQLQIIWLLHLYYIVSSIQMFVHLYIQHSLTSICYILNLLYRWKPKSQKLCFSRTSFVYVQNWKNSENSSISQLCFLFVIYLRFIITLVNGMFDLQIDEKKKKILYEYKLWKKSPTHSQNVLHVDVLYNIKRKKYKTTPQRLSSVK